MRISLVMVSPGAGGLQQSIIPYAQALGTSGHGVQLIMHAHSPLLEDARRIGFEPECVAGPHQLPLLQWWHAGRCIARFAPDAVIGFASKGYPLARLAAPEGIPVFTRVGTMDAERMRKLLTADGLIVTSEEMRVLALSLGARERLVEVVPNFLVARAPMQALRNAVPRIGSMGRFMHRKGFDLLLQAAALLKAQGRAFELVIGGAGPEADNLMRLAKRLGVDAQFSGWIENAAKPEFFQKLDIFACPSRDEPFGQIFLEAMQAGVPVVAANTVGARHIFTDGVDGLIAHAADAASLASKLAALLDDPDRCRAIAAAGQATFLQRFQTDSAGVRLAQAIAALIKNQS